MDSSPISPTSRCTAVSSTPRAANASSRSSTTRPSLTIAACGFPRASSSIAPLFAAPPLFPSAASIASSSDRRAARVVPGSADAAHERDRPVDPAGGVDHLDPARVGVRPGVVVDDGEDDVVEARRREGVRRRRGGGQRAEARARGVAPGDRRRVRVARADVGPAAGQRDLLAGEHDAVGAHGRPEPVYARVDRGDRRSVLDLGRRGGRAGAAVVVGDVEPDGIRVRRRPGRVVVEIAVRACEGPRAGRELGLLGRPVAPVDHELERVADAGIGHLGVHGPRRRSRRPSSGSRAAWARRCAPSRSRSSCSSHRRGRRSPAEP